MLFIILLLLFIWAGYEIFTVKPTDFDHLKKDEGIEPIDYAQTNYYGGFRNVSAKDIPFVNFYIFDDKFRIIVNLYRKMIKLIDIKPEDLISVSYMNERELVQSISVGKVLVFGWIGLAMKNTKEVNKEFILLKLKYEGEEVTLVLNGAYSNSNRRCFDFLDGCINKYKLKDIEV